MGKKKIILFTTLFIVAFVSLITLSSVYAVDTGVDAGGGSNADFDDNSGASTVWPTPYVGGMRVSFVRADGTHLASRDYVIDEDYDRITKWSWNVRSASKKCSRASYAAGKCSLSWDSGKKIGNVITKLSNFQNFFTVTNSKGSKYSFAVNLNTAVANNSYTGLFDALFKESNTSLSQDSYDEFITILFNNMLKSFNIGQLEDYIVPGEKNQLYNLFVVVEPVTVYRINSKYYYGTAYELANIAKNSPGGGFTDRCKGSSSGAMCDLAASVRKQLPCTSYLDGNLYYDLKEKESTILINSFSTSAYFNNNIKLMYSEMEKLCPTKNGQVPNDKVTSNYGIGMGVFWLSNYVEGEKEYTCDEIKSLVNWNNLSSTFDRLYKSGGVQAIYNNYTKTNAYPNGYLTIKDVTGSDKQIDLKWFVNECTCYGMYDYYDNTKLDAYIKENQSLINSLSKTFGTSNWYQPPVLSQSMGWVISSKINANMFFQYDNENRAYAEARGLTWTPVSEEKYHDTLNCGTNETYWCNEFDEFYENLRATNSNFKNYPMLSQIKNSSTETIIKRYKNQLETVMEAYNLKYYPATGFNWTVNYDNGKDNFSYIQNCTKNRPPTTCQAVRDFYNRNQRIDLTTKSCEALRNFDFSAYNNAYGTSINGNWYTANCGCSQITSSNCTPQFDLGDCLSGDELIYRDSSKGTINDNYWNTCVFNDNGKYDTNIHKTANKNSSLTYYEKNLGSEYCEVYCIEDVLGSFIARNINVEAGTRFNWGYSYVNTSRTCRTKSVDWDKFEEDLESANNNVRTTYNNWQRNNSQANKTAYDNAVKQAQSVVDNMEKCYDFNASDVLTVDPKATIVYDETVNYTYVDDLAKSTVYGSLNDTSNCVDEKITTVSCSNGRCTNKTETIKNCSGDGHYAEKTRTAKTTFSLKSGVYQYVLKDNHLSIHASDLSKYINSNFTANYINVGYSNLPVSYSASDGKYGVMHDKGQLDINYSNIGHVSGNQTSVDKIMSSITEGSSYGRWECEFNIYSGLIPDDGDKDNNGRDINVIYRPIDLSRPFPDIDGSDRETGSNWCNGDNDCSSDNSLVLNYINNNRNVNEYELYNGEPMYTFILTPAIVNEIRRYNDENDYSDYVGTLGSQKYDYKCETGTGEACISDYLTHIIDITGAKNQPGTCVDDRFRSYNDPDSFENCRY